MSDITEIILNFVCPGMGCIMASVMFAAPVIDLRKALQRGSLLDLNPLPWSIQMGNCLGWIAYGYYTSDAFVLAANLPGLILSLWLNVGAAKLQYVELQKEYLEMQRIQRHAQNIRERWDASSAASGTGADTGANSVGNSIRRRGESLEDESKFDNDGLGMLPDPAAASIGTTNRTKREIQEGLVMVPQERILLRVLCFWAVILVWVGWFPFVSIFGDSPVDPAAVVGIVVNLNLIFFYGAPLQVMQTVIAKVDSSLIHRPTLFMNYTNTTFWILYGFTRRDVLLILPNAMGLSLGILQGILCFLYPRKRHVSSPEDTAAVLETRPLALNDKDGEPQEHHHRRHERLKDSVVESRNVV